MKELFLLILSVVFSIGSLIAPDAAPSFQTSSDTTATENVLETENSETIRRSTPSPHSIVTGSDQNIDAGQNDSSSAEFDHTADLTALYGDPKVEDHFERGSSGFGINAGLNDDENIRIISLNNRLSLEPKKNNGWINWRLRPPSLSDSAVEMEFSIITCARGDRSGIMMRAGDYTSGHGYYFSLSCEGTVSILKDTAILNTADARGSFKNSSGDINVMAAIAQGNTLSLRINGETLLTVQDDTYAEGFNGFFTSPQGQNTLTMDVLRFSEYYAE